MADKRPEGAVEINIDGKVIEGFLGYSEATGWYVTVGQDRVVDGCESRESAITLFKKVVK